MKLVKAVIKIFSFLKTCRFW